MARPRARRRWALGLRLQLIRSTRPTKLMWQGPASAGLLTLTAATRGSEQAMSKSGATAGGGLGVAGSAAIDLVTLNTSARDLGTVTMSGATADVTMTSDTSEGTQALSAEASG